MGAGLSLIVVGAILALAVTDHVKNVNLPMVGLILMLAGVAVIVNGRREAYRERKTVTREDDDHGTRVVDEVERYNDIDERRRRRL
jgi:hypothetical protein